MMSVASQLIEEVTAHAQSDSLEDAREICADGTYFPNDLRIKNFFSGFDAYVTANTLPNMKTFHAWFQAFVKAVFTLVECYAT